MKSFLLSSVLFLAGCTTVVPVKQTWPEAPGMQSQVPCAKLQQLDSNTTLSTVAKTVAVNYDEYWMCAIKLDAWQEWYKKHKIIYEGTQK